MNNLIPTVPDLAPDYYLKNFRFLIDWVQERYADLLNSEEQHFIQQFYQLDHNAQCLLVRLSSRKGPLFRRDKLSYSEIVSIDTVWPSRMRLSNSSSAGRTVSFLDALSVDIL